MKIKTEYPPIYEKILEAGMKPNKTVLITYGDTIYNPSGEHISDDLMVHEETHGDQQGSSPEVWWNEYFKTPKFRIDQEAEAYANQFLYFRYTTHDRNVRARFLVLLASFLSSAMYGSVITIPEATTLIKQKAFL